MPLPSNVTLSLQGHSKPGDAVPSKPKQAMIIRMSAETLDALEAFGNKPPLEFAFGKNTGIYIGETFFPMRPLREQSPHELYLRSSSAAKPMAPLKLYANVTGKFTVERELGEKVQEQVRDRTQVAEKQRTERKVQMLDAPPDIPRVNGKKRKAPSSSSSSLLKQAAHNDHLRNLSAATASAGVSARVASPLPLRPTTPGGQDKSVRRRMVQYLAVSPRLTDEVVRALGGAECDSSTRKTLLELLEEVAEPEMSSKKSDKTPRKWLLKARTWLEVRPYEWKLTEPERTAMARSARLAFKDLKIPESDPAWDFVRYRSTTTIQGQSLSPSAGVSSSMRSSPSVSSTTAVAAAAKSEAKRGVMSKDAKEKKTKTKSQGTKIKAEVQMKDESAKTSRPITGKGKEPEERSKDSPALVKRHSTPAGKATTVPSPGSGSSTEIPLKKSIPGDTRPTPRDSSSSASASAKPSPAISVQASHGKKSSVASTMRISKKTTAPEKEKEPAMDVTPTSSVGVKRKKLSRDNDDDDDDAVSKTTLQKKRRTLEGSQPTAGTPPLQAPRVRDLSLPKRPSTDLAPSPRLKATHTPSPMPSARTPQPSQTTTSSTPSSRPSITSDKDRTAKINGASKPRRRSPIYTSSEDEGEIPELHTRQGLGPGLPLFMYNPRPRPPLPPASDHVALRKRYKSSYQEYITVFSFIIQQKGQIEAMLKNDSEAEFSGVELLEMKELAKLASEHQSLKDELESIKSIFLTGKLPGEASPRSD